MGVVVDLTGQTFDRWTVIERAENRNGKLFWICRCECGTIRAVSGENLKKGVSRSCGCTWKGRGSHEITNATSAQAPRQTVSIEALNHPDNTRCRTCRYGEYYPFKIGKDWFYGCQYLNIMGRRRPCKPGKDCTEYDDDRD